MSRPTMRRPNPSPKLPRLQATSPLGAWLSQHLFKVVAALLLLLVFLLAWLLDIYGFELGPEGLVRTPTAHVSTSLEPASRQILHRAG